MFDPFDDMHGATNVLVVEDEERLRQMLERALPDMGFSARGARSGEDALKLLEAQTYGIMLLDLNLPGMNGLDLFEQARARWPHVQVIVLTGFGDLEAARKAIHLDVVEFLTKPCTLGELERALDRARRRLLPDKPALYRPPAEEEADEDAGGGEASSAEAAGEEGDPPGLDHSATLQEIERDHILRALERNDGNRNATAKELGISVRTLYYRLAEYQKQGKLR